MTAFNAVRFRVKPGREQEFLDAHAKVQRNWPGLLHANLIKTAFQKVGTWAIAGLMLGAVALFSGGTFAQEVLPAPPAPFKGQIGLSAWTCPGFVERFGVGSV